MVAGYGRDRKKRNLEIIFLKSKYAHLRAIGSLTRSSVIRTRRTYPDKTKWFDAYRHKRIHY